MVLLNVKEGESILVTLSNKLYKKLENGINEWLDKADANTNYDFGGILEILKENGIEIEEGETIVREIRRSKK